MTGIYHDAIECNALFGEGECELEMFGISCMVEVDGDRYGGLVGAAERSVEWMYTSQKGHLANP